VDEESTTWAEEKRQKRYGSTVQAVQQTRDDSLRPVRNGYRLALGRVVFIRPDQPPTDFLLAACAHKEANY